MPDDFGVLELDGRRFLPVEETTFEQDLWVMAHVREAKLLDVKLDDDSQLLDVAEEIVIKAYTSGKLFLMLAGVLKEEGKDWTKEAAAENAVFFSKLTHQESKTNLQAAVVGVLSRFFMHAAVSRAISPSSLKSPVDTSDEPHPAVEVPEISENGIP